MSHPHDSIQRALDRLSINDAHDGKHCIDNLSVVAGLQDVVESLRELIGWPLLYNTEGAALGVSWPKGLLLHGPPGCGKTLVTRSVAAEFDAEVFEISAANVFGAYTGESEQKLREAFAAAESTAKSGRAAVIFLDEVDALCPRRDSQHQHEARIVAQLLTLMDGAASQEGIDGRLSIVAATNRPNVLDPALRRPGRLDREVAIPVPGPRERTAILQLHAGSLPLADDVKLPKLAIACHGYSGADLAALCREAAMIALSETAAGFLEGKGDGTEEVGLGRPVCQADFEGAMKRVGPSITRGSEVQVSPVSWESIGGLHEVKARLKQAVEWPLLHADAFQRLGLAAPRGVLLHGPPGCSKMTLARAAATGSKASVFLLSGAQLYSMYLATFHKTVPYVGCSKTTLARAAATASKASLFPLSGAQLYSMYVGEGEALLRGTFKLARQAAPSILFLDEIDSLAGKREDGEGSGGGSGGHAGVRLLSALLTEMDGMELATGVQILAATNRPQALDSALLRPGRLDVLLYVPPPDAAGRLQILQIHTQKIPLTEDVDLQALAAQCDMFTGAELAGLCREAAITALREDLQGATNVQMQHFTTARSAVRPALTAQALQQYAAWHK